MQRNPEKIENAGNLEVPEGTNIRWNIQSIATKEATIKFTSDEVPKFFQHSEEQLFTFEKGFRNPDDYELLLTNENATNKDRIRYHIDVIKDKHPELSVSTQEDSILYQHVLLSGSLNDDYGLKKLNLVVLRDNQKTKQPLHQITIPILKNQSQQNFFFYWNLDTLQLNAGEKIDYYLEVFDNDGINGSKSTRSAVYSFALPTKEELETNIRQSERTTEKKSPKASRAQPNFKSKWRKLLNNLNLIKP